MEASERIGKHEFCDMFFGPCNIDFQVFKDDSVKSLYCEVCKSLHGK
jgi:catabolite regulation protein CreA